VSDLPTCDDHGMTWNNPHHLSPRTSAPDPLTDSGVHRAMGTRVRLHLPEGETVEVGLLDVRDVSTWSELSMLVARRMPIAVEGPTPRVFAGGVVMWAEKISESVIA
jgi:hypothetical protein